MGEDRPTISTTDIERYLVIDWTHRMGKGSYGEVYLARAIADSKPVVAKIIPTGLNQAAMCQKYLFREISIWKKLLHPGLVRLRQVYFYKRVESDQKENLFFVLECENGGMNLETHFQKSNERLPEAEVQSIAFQVLQGLAYLHSHQYFHRDVKEANILIDADRKVSLCDFGFTRRIDLAVSEYTEHTGTWGYMSPEQIIGRRKYSCQVDVWALGVVILNLLTGTKVLGSHDAMQVVVKLIELFGKERFQDLDLTAEEQKLICINVCQRHSVEEMLKGRVSPEGADLLHKMLEFNPLKRIEAKTALYHPWFKHFSDQVPRPEPPKSAEQS